MNYVTFFFWLRVFQTICDSFYSHVKWVYSNIQTIFTDSKMLFYKFYKTLVFSK